MIDNPVQLLIPCSLLLSQQPHLHFSMILSKRFWSENSSFTVYMDANSFDPIIRWMHQAFNPNKFIATCAGQARVLCQRLPANRPIGWRLLMNINEMLKIIHWSYGNIPLHVPPALCCLLIKVSSHKSSFISINCVHVNMASESRPGASHSAALMHFPHLFPVYLSVSLSLFCLPSVAGSVRASLWLHPVWLHHR